jgi:hypothetical protein
MRKWNASNPEKIREVNSRRRTKGAAAIRALKELGINLPPNRRRSLEGPALRALKELGVKIVHPKELAKPNSATQEREP